MRAAAVRLRTMDLTSTWSRCPTAGSRGAPRPTGKVYRKSPDGGNDPFWQTSADGLFILQLQAALTARGLADYRAALRQKSSVFMQSGGIFGSINHDTYDPHENVAYSVAFRTLLAGGAGVGGRGHSHVSPTSDACRAGPVQDDRGPQRRGHQGTAVHGKEWDTAYLWENAEAALAYFEAAADTRRRRRRASRRYELDGLRSCAPRPSTTTGRTDSSPKGWTGTITWASSITSTRPSTARSNTPSRS